MNVSLTKQLDEFVKSKVESGMYNSSSEVIRHALRLLVEADEMNRAKLESLRAEIKQGLDSPKETEAFDVSAFLAKRNTE